MSVCVCVCYVHVRLISSNSPIGTSSEKYGPKLVHILQAFPPKPHNSH